MRCGEVGIRSHDRTPTERDSDRGNHHVDLLQMQSWAMPVSNRFMGVPALATEPTPDEAHMPLTAVSKRESFVFALTLDGLFRASLATNRWERVKTSPEMPLNGNFAAQPGRSPLIIYHSWVQVGRHLPDGSTSSAPRFA
jgi:hypothetical protein